MTSSWRAVVPLLGLGVASVVIAGLADLAMQPLRAASTRFETGQTTLHDLVARKQAIAAQLAALPMAPVQSDARLDMQGNATEGLQHLQERARASLQTVGGEPILSQSALTELSDQVVELRLLMRARVDEQAMMKFLQELEAGTPRIMTEALEVHPAAGDKSGALEFTATFVTLHVNA